MNIFSPEFEPASVTIKETQQITRLSRTTIDKLIREGKLQTIKVGRRVLIMTPSIKRLLSPERAA